MQTILSITLESAESAFLQVGVFVGAMLLFFGYFNYRYSGGLLRAIGRHRRFQILFGALLGVSPGCGGAIFMMPLYLHGVVSYGTVVATLVATMGDSSFVILSKMPRTALTIHLLSLVSGIISGHLVDALGWGRGFLESATSLRAHIGEAPTQAYPHIGHAADDAVGQALHARDREIPGTIGYEITHRGYPLYWGVTAAGLILGITLLLQQDVRTWIGIDLNRIIGVSGSALSIVWLLAGRHGLADDTHAELEEKTASLKQMFVHNAHETAFVTFWVFAASIAYGIFMNLTQLDLAELVAGAGIWPVFMTALVGLVPGCGPQIVTVTLYTQGVIPFSALASHTISQDGDALFPILAMNPRAALSLTVITTIPALAVGSCLYLAGL